MLGTSTCFDDIHSVHSMCPLMFCYVKSEPAAAYVKLFKSFPMSLVTFFGVSQDAAENINVVAGVCDHSDAIG